MLQGVSYRVLDARKKDDTSIFSILNGAPKEEIKVIRDKDTIKSSLGWSQEEARLDFPSLCIRRRNNVKQ